MRYPSFVLISSMKGKQDGIIKQRNLNPGFENDNFQTIEMIPTSTNKYSFKPKEESYRDECLYPFFSKKPFDIGKTILHLYKEFLGGLICYSKQVLFKDLKQKIKLQELPFTSQNTFSKSLSSFPNQHLFHLAYLEVNKSNSNLPQILKLNTSVFSYSFLRNPLKSVSFRLHHSFFQPALQPSTSSSN